MSWKDKLENTFKQATDYLGNMNIKEKVIELKDKTVDKVKGVDNPEHYTAPVGFELFKIPVVISTAEITKTLEKIEPFHLKEQDKIVDAYVRMQTLLVEGEKIIDAITATMKKTYLMVWTSRDRLFVIHKEHYKIFLREEVSTFKVTTTGTFGLTFVLNNYQFTGSEKSKVYRFVRSYCQENTPAYTFTPYVSVSKNLNYYERFKYGKLAKENDAVKENKELCTLFEPMEYPLVSVYGTFLDKIYILALSTNGRIFMINDEEYTIVPMKNIQKIELANKGMFSYEFLMDNYYFTGSGPELGVKRLIDYMNHPDQYEIAKNEFLSTYQVLVTFPFAGATSYQTPGGDALMVSASGNSFLICHGMNNMEMFSKDDFDHYELLIEFGINRNDMWNVENDQLEGKKPIGKIEAIDNFDKVRARIFVKNKYECAVELPFILMKKVVYKDPNDETVEASAEVTKELLDQLDSFKS